jgi:predicted ATPase
MAYPEATIFEISDAGIRQVAYEDTDHYRVTRDFLNHRQRTFDELFRE